MPYLKIYFMISKSLIWKWKIPFLDFTRNNEDKDLKEHFDKFQPCLEELKSTHINIRKFYNNHACKHKTVVGEPHNPTANILVDGTNKEQIDAFQSTIELTSTKVNSLNWKELDSKLLETYYTHAASSTQKIASYKDLNTGDIPGIWQNVTDCTQSMGDSDITIIEQLIVFSKLSEGAELLTSIPMGYKIGACIGFIQMLPMLRIYLRPGFAIDILSMFKEKISGKIMYGTFVSSSKVFIRDNSRVIIVGSVTAMMGIAYYNGAIQLHEWPSKQKEVLTLIGIVTGAVVGLKNEYELSNALGNANAEKFEAAVKAAEAIAFAIGSTVSRVTKGLYSGSVVPWFKGADDIVKDIDKEKRK